MQSIVQINSEAVAADVKLSTVGFLIFQNNGQEAVCAGTGTLCRAGAIYGILTAGHVAENLPRSGQVGLIRFPNIQPYIQNLKIDVEHTNRIVIWNGVEGSAPDIAFVRLPHSCVSSILSFGGVFCDLEKKRRPSASEGRAWAACYAIVGIVEEWLGDLPGKRPNTRLKDVHGIFGAVTIAKQYEEDGCQLLDCQINYDPPTIAPSSYGGVSGGALWELFAELDGSRVIATKKNLYGVAFRQTEISQNRRTVVCQGRGQIDNLLTEIISNWPLARS
jgi:hypothetical protein